MFAGCNWRSISIVSGNGLATPGNKSLHELMLTKIPDARWCHKAIVSWSALCGNCYCDALCNTGRMLSCAIQRPPNRNDLSLFDKTSVLYPSQGVKYVFAIYTTRVVVIEDGSYSSLRQSGLITVFGQYRYCVRKKPKLSRLLSFALKWSEPDTWYSDW